MRKIAAIASKNLKIQLNDRKGLAIAFLLPFFLATVTGLAFSGSSGGSSKLKISVVDLDASEEVGRLVESLRGSSALEIDSAAGAQEAKSLVRGRKRLAALVFPKGCGEKLASGLFSGDKADIQVLIDPSRQMELGMLQGILMEKFMESIASNSMNPASAKKEMSKALDAVKRDSGEAPGRREKWTEFFGAGIEMFDRLEKAQEEDRTDGGGAASQTSSFFSRPFDLDVVEVTGGEGNKFSIYAQTFSGTGVMFILFGVLDAAMIFIREKNRGTLKRLLASPVSKLEILLGESLYIFAFTILQLAVLFAAGKIFFGIPFAGSKAGLVAIAAATCAASTAFGIFVATIGKTEKQAQGASILAILMMSAIGGSMYPSWLMPSFLQTAGSVTINKWAVSGLEGATWRGLGFVDIVWPNAAVLSAMALILFTFAFLRFRGTAS